MCPSDEQWFAYAAGVAPEDLPARLLAHAQGCPGCAEKLRTTVEDLAESPQDDSLEGLQSSTRAWQRNLAHRMYLTAGAGRSEDKATRPWWRLGSWKPVVLMSVTGLLVAAVTVAGAWLYRRSTDDALLAMAYNQRRVTQLRLPGGRPVDIYSPALGEAETDDVLPLLKLRERAQQHLDRNPNDAYWQQVLGRIALAEGNGEKALRKLDLAIALDSTLPGIKFDRAAASFEVGEATGQPSEFLTAADLFGQVIDDPKALQLKGAAYYNRALCWDRVGLYSKAVSDFQSALKLEKNDAWRSTIQSWLDRVGTRQRNSEGRGSLGSDTSPQGFLRAMRDNPQRADANYEIYLDLASREWLAQPDARPQAALRQLGAIGLKHHDAWLLALLGSSGDARSRTAFGHLARGLRANLEGNADRALPSLRAAAGLFRQSHNTPGLLRTQAEMIYTLQRMGRSGECVKLGGAMTPARELRRYAWLYSYELLETSICRAARGDSAEYLRDIQRCIDLSRAARLPLQLLREQGMLVEALDSRGQTEEALRFAASGLKECADSSPCTPMRLYQFQQPLVAMLQEKRLWWAAADAAQAAARTSELVLNLQIRAYAREVLGAAETAAGHFEQADDAFSLASTLLDSMPNGDAASLYRADWQADRSALLERQGQLPLALQGMRGAGMQIAATDNFDVRQRHYTRMANLQLDAGKAADALNTSLTAVSDAEHALSAAGTEEERLAWERTYGRGYRLLVECLVALNKPRESLQAWEWYHSAPYRPSSAPFDPVHPAFASVRLTSGPGARAQGLILVIAQLEDFFVVWSIAGSGDSAVRMMKVPSLPRRLSETARTFTELCSDPDSSQEDINVLGTQLYINSLSRFDDQIEPASRLALEVDGSLQRLPFAALMHPAHHYLNDTHALVFLPPWWTLRSSASDIVPAKASALLVEGSAIVPSSRSGGASAIPAEYFQTSGVAAHFSHPLVLRQRRASVDQILKHIATVDVFHYNGHTVMLAEQSALLLQYPDQLFTASDLRGVSLRRCTLAVLAACSSAAASGDQSMEDASNLSHAFLAAGAANVVATLWDVDARTSQTMMLQMYDSLADSMPVAVAIRAAQLKVRSDRATGHPYFWSGVQVFTQ